MVQVGGACVGAWVHELRTRRCCIDRGEKCAGVAIAPLEREPACARSVVHAQLHLHARRVHADLLAHTMRSDGM
jgi:hypothetical protein